MKKREIPMGVFYLDKCMFIHWCDNLRNPHNSWISEFTNEEPDNRCWNAFMESRR